MRWNLNQLTIFETDAKTPAPTDLVTVCVSAFNYEKYLVEALDSVAAQTHRNLELIVVDDASNADATVAVAHAWLAANANRFHRVMLLANARNQGPSLTRNAAFERASGRYAFVLDADNSLYPRAIAELYRVAEDGGFDAAYCQLEMFGLERKLGYADIFDGVRLEAGNYIDVMALISVAAWRCVGGFDHLELGWEDYDFWLKFTRAGFSAGYLPSILCRYRVHGASRTDVDALPSHETLRQIIALRHPVSKTA